MSKPIRNERAFEQRANDRRKGAVDRSTIRHYAPPATPKRVK